MGATYTIGGVTFRRRSILALAVGERAGLLANGEVTIRRPVEWPLPGSVPDFAAAYIDPGGTDVWGAGPYLKVPNTPPGSDALVNRVFCPWGYPPQRLRVARRRAYVELTAVRLRRAEPRRWEWLLALKPWSQPAPMPDGLV